MLLLCLTRIINSLQERDTRRYKARHKRKKRVERAEMRSLPPPETVTEQKKKSPKRKGAKPHDLTS